MARCERILGPALWSRLSTLYLVSDLTDSTEAVEIEKDKSRRAEWALIEILRTDTLATITPTGDLDTIIAAKASGGYVGARGELIYLTVTGDSTSGVTIDETVNADGTIDVVIHFEDGVSTVSDVETALASTTYVEVGTTGTGANVLDVPADETTRAALALASVTDAVITGPLHLWAWEPTLNAWVYLEELSAGDVSVNERRGASYLVRHAGAYSKLALTAGAAATTPAASITAYYTPISQTEGMG